MIADASLRANAAQAGWPEARVRVAAEPRETIAIGANAVPAIIADHVPISTPKSIEDMSSHRVIWDAVARELAADPLKLTGSPTAYLHAWCDRVGVPREGFPVATVLEALIAPLFVREMAIQLQRRGVRFAIWGKGWHAIESLRDVWRGPIADRATYANALAQTSALYDVWPTCVAHPARRTGRSTIRTAGSTWTAISLTTKSIAAKPPTPPAPTFSLAQIVKWLSDAA